MDDLIRSVIFLSVPITEGHFTYDVLTSLVIEFALNNSCLCISFQEILDQLPWSLCQDFRKSLHKTFLAVTLRDGCKGHGVLKPLLRIQYSHIISLLG